MAGPDGEREARFRDVLAAFLSTIEPGEAVDLDDLIDRTPGLRVQIKDLLSPATEGHARTGGEATETLPAENGAASRCEPTLAAADGSTLTDADATKSSGDHGSAPSFLASRARGAYPCTIDDFVIQAELGRGAMGVVYKAHQVSLDRPVALKMVLAGPHAGPDTLRRFQTEVEVVALLDHPHIVPIYKVGMHNGLPYFSMKLIEGPSLSNALDRYSDPRAAARLAIEVAEAVQHAHERGVLHRDLKPGNILLDESGHPYVSDFGLALRLDRDSKLTATDAVLGTPGYLSPEQAAGRRDQVTTASDVYGLGAVLYAMLVGRAPFVADSVEETLRHVRESNPNHPSRSNPRVDRDLETICLTCLRKDPARRYASAADLAADLQRWLEGLPIAVRPVGPLTRGWFWCKRKPVHASLTAALVLSILAGLAGITINWLEIRRQSALLARERNVSEETAAFLSHDVLEQAAPELNPRKKQVTVEQALDNAAAKIDDRFAGRPAVGAAIRLAVGQTYLKLGQPQKSRLMLSKSLEIAREVHGPDARETLLAEESLAVVLRDLGDSKAAEPLIRDVAERRTRLLGRNARETLRARNIQASVLRALSRPDDAEALFRRNLADQVRVLGDTDSDTTDTRNNLAILLDDRGESGAAEAEALFRRVLDDRLRAFPADHPSALSARGNLGAFLLRRNNLDEAEKVLTALLPDCRRVLRDDHVETLNVLTNLGTVDMLLGKLDEAESLLSEALAGNRLVLGEADLATLTTLNSLALIHKFKGEPQKAEPLLRRSYELRRGTLGEQDNDTLRARFNLGMNLEELGRPDQAVALFGPVESRVRALLAPADPELLSYLAMYGEALLDLGKTGEALPRLREVVAGRRRVLPAGDWRTANAESLLGKALAAQGRPDEAEPLLVGACATLQAAAGAPPKRIAQAFDRLIEFYETTKQPAKAADWRARKTKATPPRPQETKMPK